MANHERGTIDLSDVGLERASEATAKIFADIIQGYAIPQEITDIRELLKSAGVELKELGASDQETIEKFTSELKKAIFEHIIELDHEVCIGCPTEKLCQSDEYQNRPCVKENPDIGIRDPQKFIGNLEYHPSEILREVAEANGVSPLVFPYKFGFYVNRGRIIDHEGNEKKV